MVRSVEEKRQWATGNGSHYTAQVLIIFSLSISQTLYTFQANNEQELSFMSGETLRVAPKEEQPRVRGWLLARSVYHLLLWHISSSTQDGTKIGLVPINYVKITGRQSESPPLQTPIDNLAKFEKSFKGNWFIEIRMNGSASLPCHLPINYINTIFVVAYLFFFWRWCHIWERRVKATNGKKM